MNKKFDYISVTFTSDQSLSTNNMGRPYLQDLNKYGRLFATHSLTYFSSDSCKPSQHIALWSKNKRYFSRGYYNNKQQNVVLV